MTPLEPARTENSRDHYELDDGTKFSVPEGTPIELIERWPEDAPLDALSEPGELRIPRSVLRDPDQIPVQIRRDAPRIVVIDD